MGGLGWVAYLAVGAGLMSFSASVGAAGPAPEFGHAPPPTINQPEAETATPGCVCQREPTSEGGVGTAAEAIDGGVAAFGGHGRMVVRSSMRTGADGMAEPETTLPVPEDEGTPTVDESGSRVWFEVSLSFVPSSDVVILLESNDTSEAAVAPPNLTFTPADSDSAQKVFITGVDDDVVDGTVESAIRLRVDQERSADEYDDARDQTFRVATTDNDHVLAEFAVAVVVGRTLETHLDDSSDDIVGLYPLGPENLGGDAKQWLNPVPPLQILAGGDCACPLGPSSDAGRTDRALPSSRADSPHPPPTTEDRAAPPPAAPPAPGRPEAPGLQAAPLRDPEPTRDWGLAAVVSGGAAASLVGLWLARLFSRLERDKIEANPGRARILQLVRVRPWLNAVQIARAGNRSRMSVRYHLSVLARHGLIRSVRDGRTVRFADRGVSVASFRPRWQVAVAQCMSHEPVRAVAAVQGLVKHFNYTDSGAWKAVRRAARDGLVRLVVRGRQVWVFPKPPAPGPTGPTANVTPG